MSIVNQGPGKLADGRKAVTTAGTRVQLQAASQLAYAVAITALSTNTGTIVVGGTTVVAAAATRQGTPLAAGATVTFDFVDLSTIWLDATVNGEGVSFSYVTGL